MNKMIKIIDNNFAKGGYNFMAIEIPVEKVVHSQPIENGRATLILVEGNEPNTARDYIIEISHDEFMKEYMTTQVENWERLEL